MNGKVKWCEVKTFGEMCSSLIYSYVVVCMCCAVRCLIKNCFSLLFLITRPMFFNILSRFVSLFCMFVFYFVYSVFLYCFSFCIHKFIDQCHRVENPIPVNKYHIIYHISPLHTHHTHTTHTHTHTPHTHTHTHTHIYICLSALIQPLWFLSIIQQVYRLFATNQSNKITHKRKLSTAADQQVAITTDQCHFPEGLL